MTAVAALFVETGGCYFGLPGVDPWDVERDARTYAGPHPVVAHPPCQRWGRFWHGSPRAPHRFELGDDGGCFEAALNAVRTWGGVIEHPAYSHAWRAFGLRKPPHAGGWVEADEFGGWTCHVEQGHYGHVARKGTWLYAVRTARPPLVWGPAVTVLPAHVVARRGEKWTRRQGVVGLIGGKDKTKVRNATPERFRDVLLGLVRGQS